jgi:hypothetical protein
MGLLDDAIKEHLELKRKHGAAEEELHRQETEALGPARRDFAAAAEPAEEPPAAEPADDGAAAAPQPAAEPAGWLDEEPAPPQAAAEPAAPPEPPARAEPAPPQPETLEPAAEAPDAPPGRRTSDTPTQGFDALSIDDDEEEGEEGEDVLEETPDFLQDTPEHDRLWFEQKPPRDFDFDD